MLSLVYQFLRNQTYLLFFKAKYNTTESLDILAITTGHENVVLSSQVLIRPMGAPQRIIALSEEYYT